MSVHLDGDRITLQGECRVEDAQPLLELLQTGRSRVVEISQVVSLHTAVFQVLLALRPPVAGQSQDPFLRDQLLPLLNRPDR